MRKTHAPSQEFKVNNPKKGLKPFPEATRSTGQLLSILSDCTELDTGSKNFQPAVFSSLPEYGNPLVDDKDSDASANKSSCNNTRAQTILYNVVWSKQTKKKHKTWEGDGILEVCNENAVLRDTNGAVLGRSSKIKASLEEGTQMLVGSKEIEVISVITNKENYKSKICSSRNDIDTNDGTDFPRPKHEVNNSCYKRPYKKLRMDTTFNVLLQNKSNQLLVMPRPDYGHQLKYNPDKLPINDVKLDLFLSRVLRQHQQEGVMFLYSCVTGIRNVNYNGAILADEMGLGKTLQCISLIWILLKPGPYLGSQMVQRVLIVSPSSLVTNWLKEFKKWLGFERLRPFIINQKQKLCDFINSVPSQRPVLIISYEMLIRHLQDLERCKFQLLICDEGHRLKNSQIRVAQSLSQLNIKRRIILSGTPVQNNLQEFYSLIEFINPGIVGSYAEFKKYYELPIIESNQPACSEECKQLGADRAAELNHRTNAFILRRTQSVIGQYLPLKQECVIFCSPSQLQVELYQAIVAFWENSITEGLAHVPHLSVITILKKVCNDPRLLQFSDNEMTNEIEENEDSDTGVWGNDLLKRLKPIFQSYKHHGSVESFGKVAVLKKFLHELSGTNEKVALISYFTQTLNMLEELCIEKNYTFLRLDGSTPALIRSESVDKFNASDSKYFVFLLSAKAGGVGLNLTGASRLVLFDLDWNPASDLQAMSRIWRDGQKKNVYIYRFLTTGSIEEKIYQRQISKTFLCDAVIDISSNSGTRLSVEELKDLFTFNPECYSFTHDLLCDCDGNGLPESSLDDEENEAAERACQLQTVNQATKNKNALKISELLEWEHYVNPVASHVLEELYLQHASNSISFIFRNKTSN